MSEAASNVTGAWSGFSYIVTNLARFVRPNEITFSGVNSALPMLACLLAKQAYPFAFTYINVAGGVDPNPSAVPISSSDPVLAEGSRAIFANEDFYDLCTRGLMDLCFLGAAQVDGLGRTNVSCIGDWHAPRVRLPGGGGGAVMLPTARRAVTWRTEHSRRTLVETLDFVTAAGGMHGVVTPIAVFTKREGRLALASWHRRRASTRSATVPASPSRRRMPGRRRRRPRRSGRRWLPSTRRAASRPMRASVCAEARDRPREEEIAAMPDSLSARLRAAIAHHAEAGRTALAAPDPITYADLGARIDAAAGAVRDWGVEKGDRVGLIAPKSAAAIATYFGALQAGACVCFLEPGLAPEVVAEQAALVGMRHLIVAEAYAAQVTGRALAGLDVRALDGFSGGAAFAAEIGPRDEAMLLFTSGSTGRPKGVLLRHEGLICNATGVLRHTGTGPEDRFSTSCRSTTRTASTIS